MSTTMIWDDMMMWDCGMWVCLCLLMLTWGSLYVLSGAGKGGRIYQHHAFLYYRDFFFVKYDHSPENHTWILGYEWSPFIDLKK